MPELRPLGPFGLQTGIPSAVVFQKIDLSVVRHELTHLIVHLRQQSVPGFRIFFRFEIAGETPVQQRIIESDAEPGGTGRFRILTHQIPLRSPFYARKIRILAVKKTKSLVMMGREHHVFRSGGHRSFDPFLRTAGFRAELIRQSRVFRCRDPFGIHRPFSASENGI